MNFFALYCYKSIIWLYMEHCCHAWVVSTRWYLDMLDKLQQQLNRTLNLTHAASLKPLDHYQNVASLSLFYKHLSGRCSSKLAELAVLPYSWERSTHYSNSCMIFVLPILDAWWYKDLCVNNFFASTARLWAPLHVFFFLSCNLHGFKSRVCRQLLPLGSFYSPFLYLFHPHRIFFLQCHVL